MMISRCFVGISALISEFVDDFGEGGPDYTYFRGISKEDSENINENIKVPTFPVIKVAVVLTVFLLIYVQVKRELFKKMSKPIIQSGHQAMKKHSMFHISTIAIFVVLLSIALCLVLEWTFSPFTGDKSELIVKTLKTRAISNIVSTLFLPIIVIRKNKRFQRYLTYSLLVFNPIKRKLCTNQVQRSIA